tara:strand:- start:520 stop:1791 length:1272 start_codon:yes stop_codon:yes gene_type:complete
MPLSTNEIGKLLKEFFLSPVQEQLNRETIALDMFEKARVNWAGRVAIIPVHTGVTGASGDVAFSDAGTVPDAREQTFAKLSVEARRLLARFQVDGMVMTAARKGNTDQVINWMEGSMDLLAEDVRDTMNRMVFSGGAVVGFATMNTGAIGGGVVAPNISIFGDIQKLSAEVAAAAAAPGGPFDATANLIDVNTGNQIGGANAVTITAVDTVACDCTFTFNAGISAAESDMILAVELTTSYAAAYSEQPVGIYGNLGSLSMFGTARPGNSLNSNGFKPGAAVGRQALDLDIIQKAIDGVLNESGEDIDVIFMNPLQRQSYTALLTTNMQTLTDKAGRGDGGFTGLSYGGVEIRSSRHCGRGGVILMSMKHWKLLQLDKGGFADFDGSALSRVSNTDAAEGYYRHYYNTACTRPNAQAVIAGVSI